MRKFGEIILDVTESTRFLRKEVLRSTLRAQKSQELVVCIYDTCSFQCLSRHKKSVQVNNRACGMGVGGCEQAA